MVDLDPPRLCGDPVRPVDLPVQVTSARLGCSGTADQGDLPDSGYRRVHVLLRRERWRINKKKTYRIYRELDVQLRNKTPKQRVKAKLREDRVEALVPSCISLRMLSEDAWKRPPVWSIRRGVLSGYGLGQKHRCAREPVAAR